MSPMRRGVRPARDGRGLIVGLAALLGVCGVTPEIGAQEPLSFDRYRATVEPVFVQKRTGYGPGRAPCVTCHAEQGTPLRLQGLEETPDGGVFWTEDQSRQNFEVVSRLVTPGDPDRSRLLRKALASSAGGAAFHVGGTFFESKSDPEWQAMAEWVQAADAVEDDPAAAPPRLDFEFFQECVQRIFLDKRPGDVECVHCHDSGARNFARTISDGREFWNQQESRGNFAIVRRYVEPGYPMMSRFLTHPLSPEAGGDGFHGGPRRWASRDDPEWQMLAAWVKGENPECVFD